MIKAKCGGIQLDGSTLKIVNDIVTIDGGNPTSAVVANCGGIRFDATYFKKIDKVITDVSAESVTTKLIADCGGLLLDAEYFSVSNGELSYQAPVVPSSECDITAFSIGEAKGVISGTSIAVEVPKDTDVTKLTPTITISEGATVSPASGTEKDFTDAVIYTVTAEDTTTTKAYTVTVTVAS